MSTYVRTAKPYNIKIRLRISFLSRLSLGESVVTWAIASTVFAGMDENPERILLGEPTLENDELVQLLVGGLPGVTYTIWMAARSSLNNVYVQEIKVSVITKVFPFRITTAGDRRVTTNGDDRIVGVL